MFGNNPKRPATTGSGQVLEIKNIFKTLQGEGPFAGVPAIFIRLGGCNLACNFCDTDFEDYNQVPLVEIVQNTLDLSCNIYGKRIINLVVITGGEPFRQPINNLCTRLISNGFTVQIETNGTLYRELPKKVKIICSPKPTSRGYQKIRDDLLEHIAAFKFIISCQNKFYDNVPEIGQSKYQIPVYVQPMDEMDIYLNKKNEKLAIEIALEKGYRLSYQLHKILGIE
jgi:organic radical activating enzyme